MHGVVPMNTPEINPPPPTANRETPPKHPPPPPKKKQVEAWGTGGLPGVLLREARSLVAEGLKPPRGMYPEVGGFGGFGG